MKKDTAFSTKLHSIIETSPLSVDELRILFLQMALDYCMQDSFEDRKNRVKVKSMISTINELLEELK